MITVYKYDGREVATIYDEQVPLIGDKVCINVDPDSGQYKWTVVKDRTMQIGFRLNYTFHASSCKWTIILDDIESKNID